MNTEEIIIELEAQLRQFGYEVNKQPNSELLFKTSTGQQHSIIICFLNINEARYIKTLKSDFNYKLRENLWVLLVLHIQDKQPFSYLIPSKVFETPNNIFIDNEQSAMFRHLSNYRIKVFRKGIEELSKYAFETMIQSFR